MADRHWRCCAAASVVAFSAIALSPAAHARPKYTEFDVAGSAATEARCINNRGVVTGDYFDQSGQYRGFVREQDGEIVTFDVSGNWTIPWAINASGSVAGYYVYGFGYGFLRTADGTMTTFQVEGAAGTRPSGLNDDGAITGSYQLNQLNHGFIRSTDGSITTFDVPGSVSTTAADINNRGAIAGSFNDGDTNHGFLRKPDGGFVSFDVPGSFGQLGTVPLSIDDGNTVVGFYEGQDYGLHGFSRASDGTISTFDPKKARGGATQPLGVALKPAVGAGVPSSYTVGQANGYDYNYFGFLRDPDGTIEDFQAPDAGTDSYEGTEPTAVNAFGAITGVYIDRYNVIHAFIRLP